MMPTERYKPISDSQLKADLLARDYNAILYILYSQYEGMLIENARRAAKACGFNSIQLKKNPYLISRDIGENMKNDTDLMNKLKRDLEEYIYKIPQKRTKKRIETFESEEGSFTSWFTTWSYFSFLETFKKIKKEEQKNIPIETEDGNPIADPSSNPQEPSLDYDEIIKAIKELEPELRRQVLILFCLEEKSKEEIEKKLGITKDVLYRELFKAREWLRDRLKPQLPGYEKYFEKNKKKKDI